MEAKNSSVLKITSQAEAIERANRKILTAMKVKYHGLITRWNPLNYVVGGSFRFGELTYILGASGSGKSYFLNMIRDDFVNDINKNYPYPFKILAFTFEMGADDEVIRSYSTELKTSYSDLMSSHSKITEEYFTKVKETSKKFENDIIYYVESTGNRNEILATVNNIAA
jgi:replicative DNA helicase